MADFTIGQGDQAPSISATLMGDDGLPIDLTGCTVKFNMGKRDAIDPTVSAPCTILNAVAGTVRYDWQGTDTAKAGTYAGEFQITLPSLNVVTVPNGDKLDIEVTRAVG